MNKTAQYMVKAAQLRAQADKLEKVALLLDGSDEITGLDLGLGAGALGLLGGGAYGINKLMKNRAAAKAAAAEAAKAAAEAAAQAAPEASAAAAAKAAAEAAAQAAAAKAAQASKAARNSKLLKGVLGLGAASGLTLGVGLHRYNKHYGLLHKSFPGSRPKGFVGYMDSALDGLRLPHDAPEVAWTAAEAAALKRMRSRGEL